MTLLEPPPRWSAGLLLSLTLCCGCQRSLPRVVQRHLESATPPTVSRSLSVAAPEDGVPPGTDGGWRSTSAPPTFSTNGVSLTADATGPVAAGPSVAAVADIATTAALDPDLPAPRAATLAAAGEPPPMPDAGTSVPEIHQTQYLTGATDRDMETLRQRLEQQTQVNTALSQVIVQLQRQTEAHHKTLVQLADEMNARQARQDKVTEEILSLIDQMAGGAPRPVPSAGHGAGETGAEGSGAAAAGGDQK